MWLVRPSGLLWIQGAHFILPIISPWLRRSAIRLCSCHASLALSPTSSLHAQISSQQDKAPGSAGVKDIGNSVAPDHRRIGTQQGLWTHHPSSPGSPFFTPNGTHIFQRLVSFLRAQYPSYGYQEVITPTMYKQFLWQQSGHWENYKDDMFTVHGNSVKNPTEEVFETQERRLQPKSDHPAETVEEHGLKPMNCPGHCILFASQRRSYRDLPIRYSEFSPLHRNEVSGALSGLTRVRRFHQDDGHIFCRPGQVKDEIESCLEFTEKVFKTFGLSNYEYLLSTRPEGNYMGAPEEWDRAEEQLKAALDSDRHRKWAISTGDGAFYGPKIDVIVADSDQKKHQLATIQLDFQLPKRFKLSYQAPSSELEAETETINDLEKRNTQGGVVSLTPVMIHRAIFGSLERFMAVLIEHLKGKWPFWLNPHQAIVLSTGESENIRRYAESIQQRLRDPDNEKRKEQGPDAAKRPRPLGETSFIVDADLSTESLSKKVAKAREKCYGMIIVVGQRNVNEDYLDVDMSAISNHDAVLDIVEGAWQGPLAVERRVSRTERKGKTVKMSTNELLTVMKTVTDNYL